METTDTTTELNQYKRSVHPSTLIPWTDGKPTKINIPQLTNLARAYLSVPSERVFSTAGLIINRLHSSSPPCGHAHFFEIEILNRL